MKFYILYHYQIHLQHLDETDVWFVEVLSTNILYYDNFANWNIN